MKVRPVLSMRAGAKAEKLSKCLKRVAAWLLLVLPVVRINASLASLYISLLEIQAGLW